MFRTSAEVLFDSEAVSNVIFASMCSQLHFKPHGTSRRMKMVDGLKARVLGEMEQIPIKVGGMKHAFTFLIVKKVPFDLMIDNRR